MAVDVSGEVIIAGSYSQQIFIPVPGDFEEYDTYHVYTSSGYCNDAEYRTFRALNSAGNADAVIAKIFDLDRSPFDYYRRTGASCDRSYIGVCQGGSGCPDSLSFCGSGFISSYSNTISVGPTFTYQWSNGSGANGISVSQSGYYGVTQTSLDGCFVSEDSIYVNIDPSPPQPLISDNLVLNSNASNPQDVILCSPDSVLLTGSGFGGNSHGWVGPSNSATTSVWATEEGSYQFSYTDANGCIASNSVEVVIDSLFAPIVPAMLCITDIDGNDSLSFCEGESFIMHLFDTITNPNGLMICIEDAQVIWNASPNTVSYSAETICPTISNSFTPQQSGDYLIEATILRINHCDTDIVTVSRSVYVELFPVPNLGPVNISIIGNTHICPGDSVLLVATESINYLWNGPGVSGMTNDSIWVYQQGNYSVSTSASDTNEYGCTASVSAQAAVFVQVQSQPIITMQPSNGVICPNDFVNIYCNGSGSFLWQGPNGPIGGNVANVAVNVPGTYYCIRTDSYGCEIVSNSVEIEQYATPFILTSVEPIICEGSSITLSAVSSPGSVIDWQPPLSGNDPDQTVSAEGIYSCHVTSCGIQTEVSVNVEVSNVSAVISVAGPSTVCEGDSVLLQANPGQVSYQWNPTGWQGTELTVYESGTYTLTTQDEHGCNAVSDPINVTMIENNVLPPLVNDTAICPNGYAVLHAVANGTVYWYDDPFSETPLHIGPSYTTPNLSSGTSYFVQQKSSYCPSEKAAVQVEMDDCEGIEVSTVFTPNGDGINDVFYFPQKGGTCFHCRIYNRWGKLLYQWEDANEGWNGTVQSTGELVQDGVYYYLLDFCDYQTESIQKTGFLHVMGTR